MVKLKPFVLLSNFPLTFKFKIKLVLGLLLSSFFLNYQPSFNFPPIQRNTVLADNAIQTPVVKAESLSFTFQLPHPGYLSTPFSSYHPGIDIATGLGMPIKPIAPGTVSDTYYNFWGLGLVVEVDHSSGFKSTYAHMGKIYVTKGKQVTENDFLGEVGLTGHTSGPHTHLELAKDGNKVDPKTVLPELRNYPVESDFSAINSSTPSAVLVPAIPKPQFTQTVSEKPKISFIDTKQKIDKTKLENILNAVSASTPQPIPQGGPVNIIPQLLPLK